METAADDWFPHFDRLTPERPIVLHHLADRARRCHAYSDLPVRQPHVRTGLRPDALPDASAMPFPTDESARQANRTGESECAWAFGWRAVGGLVQSAVNSG